MRRFIYASRWTDAVRRDPDLALQQIVAKSIQNNRVENLTGFLLTFDGVFLQVLEGPDAAIAETYERIASDPRHEALTVVSDEPATARAFKDWNMGGVRLSTNDPRLVESRVAQLGAEAGFDAEAAMALLRQVAGDRAGAGAL